MAKTKEQKKEELKELKEKIDKLKSMVFVDFQNLKASDLFELRKRLKENDCELKISKKTLSNLAFKEKGIKIDFKKLEGQLALVFGFKDELKPAKIVYNFSEEFERPKILGGFIENEFLEAEKVIELAKLPSKEELLAKLIGIIKAPIYNFQMVLQGSLQRLIFNLKAIR